jgi:hypothetical protein
MSRKEYRGNKLKHIELFENFYMSENISEGLNSEYVKKVNKERILDPSYKLIDKNIKDVLGIKGMLKDLFLTYVNKINGSSTSIVQQINSGDGNATTQLYLKTLTEVLNSKLNGLNSIVRFGISKYYDKNELKKVLLSNKKKIEDIYDSMLIESLMWLHDSNKKNEALWYNKSFDLLSKRKDSYIDQTIDIIIKSIYK